MKEGDALKRRDGFTMIEAVVIVAVLAILAGIVTPLVVREVAKSKVSRVRNDMEAIATAFNQYYVDTSFWPGRLATDRFAGAASSQAVMDTYTSLYTDPTNLTGWDGPYLERGVLNGATMQATKGAGNALTGLCDPWKIQFRIVYGAAGAAGAGAAGAISVVSAGPDRVFQTTDTNALMGEATGDDVVRVITRRAR
jgi:type II secretory pathway pseudopilin PulG